MNHSAVIVGPCRHDQEVAAWNPWASLRAQPEVEFALADDLPVSAIYARRGEERAIVLNRGLGRRRRNEALAHELIHHERGGGADQPGMPASWDAVVARDEIAVEREVARRLLPLGELQGFVDQRVADHRAVTALDVAEEFDCTEDLAALALRLIPRETR